MTGRSQGFDTNRIHDELVKSGRVSKRLDTIGVLLTVDEAIEEERKHVNRINKRFTALDIVMTIVTFAIAFGTFLVNEKVKDYEK